MVAEGQQTQRARCAAIGLGTFALVGGLRWPMVWVVLGLGSLGMALAWRRIRAAEAAP